MARAKQDIKVDVNAIEPGRRRRRSAEASLGLATAAATTERPDVAFAASAEPDAAGRKSDVIKEASSRGDDGNARVRLLIDGLNKQYLKADDRYHFRDKDGTVAFEAQDRKLLTPHETPSVVASMVDLAETRGWSSLKLTGTKEFRREAWLQASLRAIEVCGYQPSKLDLAKLDEVRAERKARPSENAIEPRSPTTHRPLQFEPVPNDGKPEAQIPLTAAQHQFLKVMEATMRHRGDDQDTVTRAVALGKERLTNNRVHVGKLVDIGSAPYLDKRGEKPSHFVTLEDDKGVRSKVWGVDLPRALAESGAESGQWVAVAYKGRQPVSIEVPVRDAAGTVIRTQKQMVDRNSWEVVPFDRLREEAKASVIQALKKQDQPAEMKIFDRNARPVAPKFEVARQSKRTPERTL